MREGRRLPGMALELWPAIKESLHILLYKSESGRQGLACHGMPAVLCAQDPSGGNLFKNINSKGASPPTEYHHSKTL